MTTTLLPSPGPGAPLRVRAREVVILNFHGVGAPPRRLEPGEDQVWLSESSFLAALDATEGADGVELTFDDGNASDLEIVLPVLLERRRTAAFFVPAAFLGKPGRLARRDLASLAAAGMRVGTHGMRHRPWVGLTPDEMDEEFRAARAAIEDACGTQVLDAACPFGAYDRRTLAALRAASYARVLTSDRGPAASGAWLQPRNTVHASDTPERVSATVARRPGAVAKAARAARLAVKRWRWVRVRSAGRPEDAGT